MTGGVIQPKWDLRQRTAVQMRVRLVDIEPAIWGVWSCRAASIDLAA